MSKNSIKAVDLHCRVSNWDNGLQNAYPDEVEPWTMKRNREAAKLRKVLPKITLKEFLSGRWGNTPMDKRVQQWNEMLAAAAPLSAHTREGQDVRLPKRTHGEPGNWQIQPDMRREEK